MPLRAVVFDLFDTLVDLRWERVPQTEHAGRKIPAALREMHGRVSARAELPFEAFLEALEAGRRDFAESHLRRDREVPTALRFRDLLARLGLEAPELAEELTLLHMGGLRAGVVALEHHRGVLAALARRLRLAVCSNFSHSPTALHVIEGAGLAEHLDPRAVVISDACGWRKPHARIFEEVLARLGLEPAEAVHVGDSLRADVAGAAALGMRTVWITRRIADPDAALAEHEGPKPDHVVADLAELGTLLDGA